MSSFLDGLPNNLCGHSSLSKLLQLILSTFEPSNLSTAVFRLKPVPSASASPVSSTFPPTANTASAFSIACTGGARLFLHDIRLIDAHFKPGAASEKTHHKVGWHPTRLSCHHVRIDAIKLHLSLTKVQGQEIPMISS